MEKIYSQFNEFKTDVCEVVGNSHFVEVVGNFLPQQLFGDELFEPRQIALARQRQLAHEHQQHQRLARVQQSTQNFPSTATRPNDPRVGAFAFGGSSAYAVADACICADHESMSLPVAVPVEMYNLPPSSNSLRHSRAPTPALAEEEHPETVQEQDASQCTGAGTEEDGQTIPIHDPFSHLVFSPQDTGISSLGDSALATASCTSLQVENSKLHEENSGLTSENTKLQGEIATLQMLLAERLNSP